MPRNRSFSSDSLILEKMYLPRTRLAHGYPIQSYLRRILKPWLMDFEICFWFMFQARPSDRACVSPRLRPCQWTS